MLLLWQADKKDRPAEVQAYGQIPSGGEAKSPKGCDIREWAFVCLAETNGGKKPDQKRCTRTTKVQMPRNNVCDCGQNILLYMLFWFLQRNISNTMQDREIVTIVKLIGTRMHSIQWYYF